MKTYRRIEITAFRRRVTIVSGGTTSGAAPDDTVMVNDADSNEAIPIDSDDGRKIMIEALGLLKDSLSEPGRTEIPAKKQAAGLYLTEKPPNRRISMTKRN